MSDRDELDWIIIHEPWRIRKTEKLVYTEQELYDLTKVEQVKILKKYGIEDIPKYERERVDKIIEIIKGGD